jgi:hypothetical protein
LHLRGARAASILPFIPHRVFDDAATKFMGEAFDAACEALRDPGPPTVVYEVLARRIIAAARKGERDVARLRNIALEAFARGKHHIQ